MNETTPEKEREDKTLALMVARSEIERLEREKYRAIELFSPYLSVPAGYTVARFKQELRDLLDTPR